MQSEDLRIGNWIETKGLFKDSEVQVKTLDVSHVNGFHSDYVIGLQLTEQLLIDLGFSKMTDTTPYNYRIHKSKMFFYIRYGTFTTDGGKTDLIGFNGLFIANKFVRVIKYVHELQNIYFALTGEELELKSESKS